jgi:deoxyribodipyrimidine photolyase-related protein
LPINSVEGFIRQIIVCRKYIKGVYWYKIPEYKNENFLSANRKLPKFFWQADSKMNSINQYVKETKSNAYAHRIQRLNGYRVFCFFS